jgi:hypothetical protein
MSEKRTPEELTEDDLAEANGEPLPDRQAMTLIRGVEIGGGVIPVADGDEIIHIDDPNPNPE